MSVYRSAAAAVPSVPAGTVLNLGPDDWAYSYGRSLRLRVQRIHEDLAHCYPDRLWVEGWVLGPGHEARGWTWCTWGRRSPRTGRWPGT